VRKILALFLQIILIGALAACSGNGSAAVDTIISTQQTSVDIEDTTSTTEVQSSASAASTVSVEYDADDLDATISSADISYVKLNGDSIAYEGSGATVNGSIITITGAGVYNLSGTLDDGQIRVDAEDTAKVTLVLDGVNITYSISSPIHVVNAEKVILTLADGTENILTDGSTYVLEDPTNAEPNAAIFSKDDLTINGRGSLTVHANHLNGILSKDNLKIIGGTITVTAVNDGIRGRNSIAIKDGIISINAGGDGMQSNNDEETGKGYISIEGGTIVIVAGLDGIQAETSLLLSAGDITITTGGGSINSSSGGDWGMWGMDLPNNTNDTTSAKGLKAGVDITVTGGTITIDSSDDSIHTNNSIIINGGAMLLASGDDGMHSDTNLVINGGDITITKSYEGVESASLIINNGTLHIASNDDGLNTSGGNDGSAINGRPGQNDFAMSGDYNLYINGGYIFIDALGDGMDINGTIDMTAGTVIINGPTSDGNGALDYLGSFDITGGYLLAVGSAGMAQAPSQTSTQYSIMHNYTSRLAAGTIIHIQTEAGDEILTFEPTKDYQSIVFSSPELTNGMTYLVYSGGSATGTSLDGLYTSGTYTGNTQVASLTISSIVTGSGMTGRGFPSGGGGGGMPPQP
jgi:hypothetical protein